MIRTLKSASYFRQTRRLVPRYGARNLVHRRSTWKLKLHCVFGLRNLICANSYLGSMFICRTQIICVDLVWICKSMLWVLCFVFQGAFFLLLTLRTWLMFSCCSTCFAGVLAAHVQGTPKKVTPNWLWPQGEPQSFPLPPRRVCPAGGMRGGGESGMLADFSSRVTRPHCFLKGPFPFDRCWIQIYGAFERDIGGCSSPVKCQATHHFTCPLLWSAKLASCNPRL